MIARRATEFDAPELIRLRVVMLRGMDHPWDDDWQEPARTAFAARLSDPRPTMAAFVVDRPSGDGLASCAVGTLELRVGGPGDPAGRVGYVFNVATDPDHRRRGYSRACMVALIDWFRAEAIHKIDLRASRDAEPLYRSLGFARTADPAMRLRL